MGWGLDYRDMPAVRGIVRSPPAQLSFFFLIAGIVKSAEFQMQKTPSEDGESDALHVQQSPIKQGDQMFITKKHLPRRSFLRGMSATLGAAVARSDDSGTNPATKTARAPSPANFIYVPHGAVMDKWTPEGEGSTFTNSRILSPLDPFHDRVTDRGKDPGG